MSNYTGRNNSGTGRTSGYKGPAAVSTKAAVPVAADDKQKPAFNLSMSIEGEEKLVQITGVFANESKSGTKYYAVKVKEEIVIPAGAKLMLFANTK